MKHGTICILKPEPGAEWEVTIPPKLLADTDIAPPQPDRTLALSAAAEQVLAWMTAHTAWIADEEFHAVGDSVGQVVGGQVFVLKHEEPAPVDEAGEQAARAAREALGQPGTLGYLRAALAQLAHLPDDMPVVLAATSEGNGFKRLDEVGNGTDPEPDEDDLGLIAEEDYDEYDELPPPCLLLWPR
jgi:hypothetical protein